jgi:hypothetical protein
MQDEFPNTRTGAVDTSTRASDPITVVALYETLPDAERALDGLLAAGYDRSRISLVASNAAGEYDAYARRDEHADDVVDADRMGAGEGAVAGGGIGAAVGGVGGVLMGLGLLAIPGIGPALAAGPLVSGLIGAGIGAAAGSVMGALVNAGVPEERAGAYAEGVRRGGTLLVVETTASAAAAAEEIMLRHGSVDIEERQTRWRSSGWSGFDESAEPYTREQIERERSLYGSAAHPDTGRPRR